MSAAGSGSQLGNWMGCAVSVSPILVAASIGETEREPFSVTALDVAAAVLTGASTSPIPFATVRVTASAGGSSGDVGETSFSGPKCTTWTNSRFPHEQVTTTLSVELGGGGRGRSASTFLFLRRKSRARQAGFWQYRASLRRLSGISVPQVRHVLMPQDRSIGDTNGSANYSPCAQIYSRVGLIFIRTGTTLRASLRLLQQPRCADILPPTTFEYGAVHSHTPVRSLPSTTRLLKSRSTEYAREG